MKNQKIKGALTAVLTAFNEDLTINFEKTISNAKKQLDAGLDGVVFFGTTGEGNSINVDEKKLFVEKLMEFKFPLNKTMIGTGSCSIMDAINLTKFCVEKGINDCLMLPPFYYKNPKDDGLFQFFSEVIQRVGSKDLRIQIYHFPAISQIPITHNLIGKLLKDYPENFCGIKDSGGDLNNMLSMCKNFENFDVYAGSEAYFLDVLEAGGAGTITATGNLTYLKCIEVMSAYKLNDQNKKSLQDELTNQRNNLQKACSSYGFVSGLKEILSDNIQDNSWRITRPPFKILNEKQKKEILNKN